MMNDDGNQIRIPVGEIDWGNLRNQDPVSDCWGFDRGQPIDRYFIEKFLQRHATDIQGCCLEVRDADYTRKFGGPKVRSVDVIDINESNPNATIVGDLTDPTTLSRESYDCFVFTQTLPVIYDTRAILRNSYAALKPGGVLLITAPAMCRYSPHPGDYWRFTDTSLYTLLEETTDSAELAIDSFGNLIASMAFLIGAASQELNTQELEHHDKRFPIVVTARVRKAIRSQIISAGA